MGTVLKPIIKLQIIPLGVNPPNLNTVEPPNNVLFFVLFFVFKVIKLSKDSYLYTLGGVVNSVNKENKVWSLTMGNYSLLASSPKIIKWSAQKVVALQKVAVAYRRVSNKESYELKYFGILDLWYQRRSLSRGGPTRRLYG